MPEGKSPMANCHCNSTEFQCQLAIGDLPSGIYFCRISTEMGGVFWEKVEVVR